MASFTYIFSRSSSSSRSVIIEYLSRLDSPKLTLVAPDAGGAERARAYAKRLGGELAVIDKRRSEDGTAEVMNVIGEVAGRTCIIQDDIESITGASITGGLRIPYPAGGTGLFPVTLAPQLTQQIKIDLKPGTVNIVPVGKKSFKGTNPRVSITGFRIKIDGCAGQSFIRSYATLTSSTDNTDDVVTYLGVTKAV